MSTLRWEKKGQLDLYGKQSGKTVGRGKKRRNKLERNMANIFFFRKKIVKKENKHVVLNS